MDMTYIAGSMVNMPVVWLVAVIALLIIEGLAPGLVSIWFALGALAALISALLGAPLWLQALWFVLVSVASLCLTRPLAKKYINAKVVPTNADMLVGKECIVKETVDNIAGTGAVAVDGKTWSARMADETERAAVGEVVSVLRIEGVKLIVAPKAKE
jgi:membrane protein implicated in regulation of membrane protease activity